MSNPGAGGSSSLSPMFRGRRPTPLAFGTSGLRGLVSDITDLEAYINTAGFLHFLLDSRQVTTGDRIALGGDLRASTPRILEAVARAVRETGLVPEYHGSLPTPALTHYGIEEGIASVMVTGSHIPFDRNGIKFNRPDGEVLKSDEAPILAAVSAVRACEYSLEPALSAFDDTGALRAGRSDLPPAQPAAIDRYRARYRDAFPDGALAGLRIGFFAHSAVGRDLLPALLRDLGAEVVEFGRADSFVAIDTEALSPATLAEIEAMARQAAAQAGVALDAVVSTDGDSDRPMLLGVNEDGALTFFSGDLLGLAVADYLDADSVTVPVSATDAIDRHFAERGVPVQRSRIGSPWVIDLMARSDGKRRVGWEANGGFLTGSALSMAEGELAALPTRDAALPIIAALHAARVAGRPLVEHFRALPQRASGAGLLDHVDPADSRALLSYLGPGDSSLRLLRFSAGADAGIEAFDHAGEPGALSEEERHRLAARRALIEQLFTASGHCTGGLAAMDALDGLRLYFGDGDIAHIRPSGNAPQLRIYAVTDVPEATQQIVATALAEPDGILRRLLSVATGRS